MNKKNITFKVNRRKFTTKLILNIKSQNKIYFYIISNLKKSNVIDLTLIENKIIGDDKENPIIINLISDKDNFFLSEDETK